MLNRNVRYFIAIHLICSKIKLGVLNYIINSNFRDFFVTNVPQYGNCFMYNAKYNFEDSIMYRKDGDGYIDTGKSRVSSLTGPSFGLNLITTLGQMNYMDGAITKQVCEK